MALARASRQASILALMLLALATHADDFDTRIAESEKLLAQAEDLGYEWLETARLLEQARDEAANGNIDAATVLVEKARFQASAAIKQAEHEADAWRERVPR